MGTPSGSSTANNRVTLAPSWRREGAGTIQKDHGCSTSKLKYYKCGRIGHMRRDCRFKKNDKSTKIRSRSVSPSTGKSHRSRKRTSSNASVMAISANYISKDERRALKLACEANECFDDILIDSGASEHVANDTAHFNFVKT